VDGAPEELFIDGLSSPGHGTARISVDGRSLVYTPAANYNGHDQVFYDVSDGRGGRTRAELRFEVREINDAPDATTDIVTTDEDTSVVVGVLENDTDLDGDELSIESVTLAAAGQVQVLEGGKSLRYAPKPQFHGTDDFSYTLADGRGGRSTATVRVTVREINDPPTVGGFLTLVGAEATRPRVITFAELQQAGDEADSDGDTVSFRIERVLAGTLTKDGVPVEAEVGGELLREGESWSWTPPTTAVGLVEAFVVRAWDGRAASEAAVPVRVLVETFNEPPQVSGFAAVETDEDTPVSVSFTLQDDHTAPQDLILKIQSSDPALIPQAGLVLSGVGANRTVLVTPSPDRNGSATLQLTASDERGSESTVHMTIRVRPAPDRPRLTRVGPLSGAIEDSPYEITYEALLAVTDATDADGDTLSFLVRGGGNGSLSKAGIEVGAAGIIFGPGDRLVWTPPLNANGLLTACEVLAFDGQNLSLEPEVVRVNVLPVNDPPTLTHIETTAGASLGATLTFGHQDLTLASDAADVDGDLVSFLIEETRSGLLKINGAAVIAGVTRVGPGQELTWTPTTNGVVTAFTVRAFDGVSPSTLAVPVRVAVSVPVLQPTAKLIARVPAPVALFGNSVSLFGETAVVGAYLTDVNGKRAAGSAYVYTKSGTNWVEQAKLTASDAAADARFGCSVSIFGDTIVVGANQAKVSGLEFAGAAYVFVRQGTNWIQHSKLTKSHKAEFDLFGTSVAIFGDALVVGASQAMAKGEEFAGQACVFERSGGAWVERAQLEADDASTDDGFGISVSMSADSIVVGAFVADLEGEVDAGAAYIFGRSTSGWVQQTKLQSARASRFDRFGSSVSISGDTVVIGANRADLSEGNDGGASYVYVRTSAGWVEQARLTTSDGLASDWLGTSVAISGDTIVVGAFRADLQHKPDSGGAYLFQRSGTLWTETAKLLATDPAANDRMGSSVGLFGGTVIVGTQGADLTTTRDAGASYVFETAAEPDRLEQTLHFGPEGDGLSQFPTLASFRAIPDNTLARDSVSAANTRVPVSLSYSDSAGHGVQRVIVSGPLGQRVQLWASSDLNHWEPVHSATLQTVTSDFWDALSIGAKARFYKVVVLAEGVNQ